MSIGTVSRTNKVVYKQVSLQFFFRPRTSPVIL
jgi:hypothetical protein